jgi:hypothetical protein
MMLVHGGYSADIKKTLNDFNIFDLSTQKWVKVQLKKNGVPFNPGLLVKNAVKTLASR